LQFVSDSADSLRRQRGRRGLEVLGELQESKDVNVVISDIDVEGVREVDDKLVLLGRQMNYPILTNDFNLNRVAELQGVKVLNINDLANAVKVIILPGESLQIEVIQEGKEYNQGVGYLDDGTMVVIENGQRYIDKQIEVTVTKILQTSAGRMIFAKPSLE
ncbi:MAG: PIN domain nuclease, partial [Anaerolineaceae bacterium]